MFQNRNIKKGFAVLLLLTSLLSITPQKMLHNIVAGHIDKEKCLIHKNLPIDQIESAGIVCSYDLTVNTIPYLFYDLSIQITRPTFTASKNLFYKDSVYNFHLVHSDTRGSPIIL